VFGQVLDGMHVVDRIKGVPTSERLGFKDVPVSDVVIQDVQLVGME